MTNAGLADEIERFLAPDAIYHHWDPSMEDMEQIIAALRRQPSSDKVLVLQSFAKNRCYACGWPLAGSATEGCTPFNCSYRPSQGTQDHDAWLKRAHEMENVRAMLAAAEAEGHHE